MKKRMYALFAIVVIVFVFGFLALDKYNVLNRNNGEGLVIDTTAQYFINNVDSSVISEIDSVLFETQISKIKYHIIVGSFKDVENAKKLQYVYPDCKILPVTDSGFHRVSILEYDNLDDCIKKLKSFKINNGDAWIYKEEYK